MLTLAHARPQHTVFSTDVEGFSIDDQYYLGSSGLLIKPITRPGVDRTTVYLSDNQPYYDYYTHRLYPASTSSRRVDVPAPLEKIPLLVQGGNILPLKNRVRKASTMMWRDPFTLVVALGVDGQASGVLYMDDGDSYDYTRGQYVFREFAVKTNKSHRPVLSNHAGPNETAQQSLVTGSSGVQGTWQEGISDVQVERIIVLGLDSKPSSVKTNDGTALEWSWEAGASSSTKKDKGVEASRLVIKKPGVKVIEDWSIEL